MAYSIHTHAFTPTHFSNSGKECLFDKKIMEKNKPERIFPTSHLCLCMAFFSEILLCKKYSAFKSGSLLVKHLLGFDAGISKNCHGTMLGHCCIYSTVQ